LDVLPRRTKPQPRMSSTGIPYVYHRQRNGRFIYLVHIERGQRQRHATFPDTPEGLECARLQATAWCEDIDALPLFPPPRAARAYQRPGALGAPGLSIWRAPRSDKCYYRFSCQRPACREWRCFPYTPEGLVEAQRYARQHFRATNRCAATDQQSDK